MTLLRGARGRSLGTTIQTLNPVLRGWAAYFKLTEPSGRWRSAMDGYGTSCAASCGGNGNGAPRAGERNLLQRGLPKERAWRTARNGVARGMPGRRP